jgi:hypothetical protein
MSETITQIQAARHENRRQDALERVEAAEQSGGTITMRDLDLAYGGNPHGEPLTKSVIDENLERKERLYKVGRLIP